MRDPARLYIFYNKLQEIHITYFPDWRFTQLISNFEYWLRANKNIHDIFYLEEDNVLNYMNEYVKDIKCS